MSMENAKKGLAARPGWAQEDHWALIGRIPDLSPKTASTALEKPVEVRSLSRALSFHLLLGLGLGLLVGMALPFVFGTARQPNTPAAEPPSWFYNSGMNQPGNPHRDMNHSGLINLSQNRAAEARVASVPEPRAETGSNITGAAAGGGTILGNTTPTWLSPLSTPIDMVFLSQTLTETTSPRLPAIDAVRLPQPLSESTSALLAPIDAVRLPQPPMALPRFPAVPNRNADARRDHGGGNPLRSTTPCDNTGHDNFSSAWPGVTSWPRTSDPSRPTPPSRIPKTGIGSEPMTTVPPGRNRYDAATSSTH